MFQWISGWRQRAIRKRIIRDIYGSNPPQRRADVNLASELACKELLLGAIEPEQVREVASVLYETEIPYSTHDLALVTALTYFSRRPGNSGEQLANAQLFARMTALTWAKEGKVAVQLLKEFEDKLYKTYKPGLESDRSEDSQGKPKADRPEVVTTTTVGIELAKLPNGPILRKIADDIGAVQSDPRPFVALASLYATAIRIAASNEKEMGRLAPNVPNDIYVSYCMSASMAAIQVNHFTVKAPELCGRIHSLAERASVAFYSHTDSKPPKPAPHWFAAKEVATFLVGENQPPNPEDIMSYASILANGIASFKRLIDDFQKNGVLIVARSK